MSARVHVEGGGTGNKALKAECRRAFREFFTKAGSAGRLPRIVPGGGRIETYDDFCTALRDPGNDAFTVLLVDSEAPVAEGAVPGRTCGIGRATGGTGRGGPRTSRAT